jgi:phosphoadenosine phosphosulfate reductase
LARALEGKVAWMTGLRREEAPTRANSPIVSYDVGRGMVKVNPLATWTDFDVEGYTQDRGLPAHPLAYQGYRSIGCWPCSRPVADGEDPRAGRWAGTDKIECGLHS